MTRYDDGTLNASRNDYPRGVLSESSFDPIAYYCSHPCIFIVNYARRENTKVESSRGNKAIPLPVNIGLLSGEVLISDWSLRDAPKRDGNKLTSATEGRRVVVAFFFQGLTNRDLEFRF